jgi:dethiobiotin synthetase
MRPLIVTGTDTGVGKTIVSAMLTLVLDGIYWKPIQAGTSAGTDTMRVAEITGLPEFRFRAERYVLRQALSPHLAAELEDLEIQAEDVELPNDVPPERVLIVEGAGGVLVPINRETLQVMLFARWRAPVILCARTTLGTINHTLLSLEALKLREIEVLGIIFVGNAMPDSERTIMDFGKTKRLGRMPLLPDLNAAALRGAFKTHFDRRDFETAYER